MWAVVWGILPGCPELRTTVSAVGPEAERACPWPWTGGIIFLVKTDFSGVKKFVICINFAIFFCRRKRGGEGKYPRYLIATFLKANHFQFSLGKASVS